MRILLAAALAALVLRPAPARAMTPEDEALAKKGMDLLFDCDYDGADALFAAAMKERPGDPVPSLGAAAAAWWRMENDFALPGSPEEKAFKAAVKKAIDDAQKATKGHDVAEARLYLGAAYGLRGRWEAARRRWFSAYMDGRRSYMNERTAIHLDPELYDAYLGLGAFDYYTATLSGFLRAFTFNAGGDKGAGLLELRTAAEKGRFSPIAAKLLLAGIDWTFEKKPEEARDIVEALHKERPDSPLIDSMRLVALFQLRQGEALAREARVFLRKAEGGAPHFLPIDAAAGRYFLGLGLELDGKFEEAKTEFETALKGVPPNHRWRGMIRLYIGECLDGLGRRDEAVALYKAALREPPMWGVQRYAKHLIKHPFKAGENPLPSRNDALE